jgi:hypothetical protein
MRAGRPAEDALSEISTRGDWRQAEHVYLNRIQQALRSAATSAILGGSLSYGRFFNTTGGQSRPSDVDLIVVVPDDADSLAVVEALRPLEFISRSSLDEMEHRLLIFPGYRQKRCVFLHKLRLWESPPSRFVTDYQVMAGHYKVALHLMTFDDLLYLILRDRPRIPPEEGFIRRLVEFRDDHPSRSSEELKSFSNARLDVSVNSSIVDGGYLADHVVCQVTEGRFYPGAHMNLVLPRFEVRWEDPHLELRLLLLAFRWKLVTRLGDENRARDEVVRLSYSHTRSAAFSPHVTRRVDEGSAL